MSDLGVAAATQAGGALPYPDRADEENALAGFGPGIGVPIRMNGGRLSASLSITVSDVGTRGDWSNVAVEAGGDPSSHSASLSGIGIARARGSSNIAVEASGDTSSQSRSASGIGIARGSSRFALEAGGLDSRSGTGVDVLRSGQTSNVAVEDS